MFTGEHGFFYEVRLKKKPFLNKERALQFLKIILAINQ